VDLAIRIAAIALAFGLTVFVHELGHFLAARLAGMAVYEFSIGFGRPLLFWFRRGDTQYSFRLWPFLSYVRIAGMEPDDDHPQGFGKKRRAAQAAVLSLGSVMNCLLAVGIFVFMGTVIGMPVYQNYVDKVIAKSPAQQAGLLPGDRIIGVNGRVKLTVSEIRDAIHSYPGKAMVLEIERGGRRQSIRLVPQVEAGFEIHGLRIKEIKIGLIGIQFGRKLRPVGVGESVKEGFLFVYGTVQVQIAGIVGVIARTIRPEFMGPVGMADMLYAQAKQGWTDFLWTFAVLTVAVGFLNLLPLPALDGSRLVIVGIEAIRGKPFDKRKEAIVHLVGLMAFLCLAVLIAYGDVVRILRQKGP